MTTPWREPPSDFVIAVGRLAGLPSLFGLFFIWPMPTLIHRRWLPPALVAWLWLLCLVSSLVLRWFAQYRARPRDPLFVTAAVLDVLFIGGTLLPPGLFIFAFVVLDQVFGVRFQVAT